MSGFTNEYSNMHGHGRHSRHGGRMGRGMGNNINVAVPCAPATDPNGVPLVTVMQNGVPTQMTAVAAQMAANQNQQITDNTAALAAAAAAKNAPAATATPAATPAPTSGIDGFDNFMGKKIPQNLKIPIIVVGSVLALGAFYLAYRHFKKSK